MFACMKAYSFSPETALLSLFFVLVYHSEKFIILFEAQQ